MEAFLAPHHRLAPLTLYASPLKPAPGFSPEGATSLPSVRKPPDYGQPNEGFGINQDIAFATVRKDLIHTNLYFKQESSHRFAGLARQGVTELDNPGSCLAARLLSCVVRSRAKALVALTAHPFAITYGTRGIDKSGSVHRLSSNTSRLERFHWDGYNATVATVRASE